MMKKLLLFFIVALLSTSYISAQSLSLSLDGTILPDTVFVYAHPDSGQIVVFHARVTNNSESTLRVKVIRTNVDTVPGTVNSFCFANQCEMPTTDTSYNYLELRAGESSDGVTDMIADYYYPVGTIGTSTIKYTFFNIVGFNDYAEVVVKFWTSPTAIDENLSKYINISNLYPNPALNVVNLNYTFDINVNSATVKIINLLGSVVKEVEIDQNENKLRIDISDLNAGIYFYSVVVNNDIFQTKKLVIR